MTPLYGPATLTIKLVESLIDWAHPNGEGLDPNYAPDRMLARDIQKWIQWYSAGCHGRAPHLPSMAIARRLNYRDQNLVVA